LDFLLDLLELFLVSQQFAIFEQDLTHSLQHPILCFLHSATQTIHAFLQAIFKQLITSLLPPHFIETFNALQTLSHIMQSLTQSLISALPEQRQSVAQVSHAKIQSLSIRSIVKLKLKNKYSS